MLKITNISRIKPQQMAPDLFGALGAMGDEPWYNVATPGHIWDRIKQVDKNITSLGNDIRRYVWGEAQMGIDGLCVKKQGQDVVRRVPCTNPRGASWWAFVEEWGRFVWEWKKFIQEHDGGPWNRFWGGVYDQTKDYQDRLVSWHERFKAMGGERASGAPDPVRPTKGGFPTRTVVYAMLGVVGIWGAVKVTQAFKSKE